MPMDDGRKRVVIEGLQPAVDGGRFPIKRILGDTVQVEADCFTDGHDSIAAALRYRPAGTDEWSQTPLTPLINDRWRGAFTVTSLGLWEYAVQAWADHALTWRRNLAKRVAAGQEVAVELEIGADLLERAARGAPTAAAVELRAAAAILRDRSRSAAERTQLALSESTGALASAHADRTLASDSAVLQVIVDPEIARAGAWYEMFPRSAAAEPGRHGTLRDTLERLPYVAAMGFDVLYLPPLHPIGLTHRKGRNNTPEANPDDPGSPWAIGAPEGGHCALHPALGTLEDFDRLAAAARRRGLELALDIAFQASPDHPLVGKHPEWFRHRPDGTVQYAENPPKKYEDIFPFDFESEAWPGLWEELRGVLTFWIGHGVRIFRVDNPHTKPFAFWEWAIREIKREHPEVIFLAEAFTRPKVMMRLAKLGFSQSYTYFAWRNTKEELTQYFTELAASGVREFFRPSLWPNTPDILTEYLQTGGRPAFIARLVLAATLGATYGVYGPPFEQMIGTALRWGSEEYLDSEKYQVRHWDVTRPDSLSELIAWLNRLRREHPGLRRDDTLRFHPTDNDHLICYSKTGDMPDDTLVVVVNLDPWHTQSGWVTLDLEPLALDADESYQVHDLLAQARYLWHGSRNYVELNPQLMPASIFRPRRRLRSERDFEYFM